MYKCSCIFVYKYTWRSIYSHAHAYLCICEVLAQVQGTSRLVGEDLSAVVWGGGASYRNSLHYEAHRLPTQPPSAGQELAGKSAPCSPVDAEVSLEHACLSSLKSLTARHAMTPF